MAAGVTERVWEIADIVALLDDAKAIKKAITDQRREDSYHQSGSALGHDL